MRQGTTQFTNTKLNAIAALTPTNKLPVVGDGSSYVMGTSGIIGVYRLAPVSLTNANTQTEAARMTFPANHFQEGDQIEIILQEGWRTGATPTGTNAFTVAFFSNSASFNLISLSASTSARRIIRWVNFENSIFSCHPDNSAVIGAGTWGGAMVRNTMDFTQQSSLRINYTPNTLTDTWWVNEFVVTHKRSSIL